MFTINKKKKSLNIHSLLVSELDKLKANNIVLIDLKDKSPLADFMIIAGGNSSRHVNSMAQKSVEFLKDNKVKNISIEGMKNSDWVLKFRGLISPKPYAKNFNGIFLVSL